MTIEELGPEQVRRLRALRVLSRLLDSAFAVPGTRYRIGLDPILGVVPWLGDVVSPLFALALLWTARDLGVPRVVQARMVFNVAIDALIGVVPLVGDLFDVAWKANDWNMALLERHAYGTRRATAGDWVFVLVMSLVVIVIALVPLVLLGALVGWIGQWLA